jgi:hypothetical protein
MISHEGTQTTDVKTRMRLAGARTNSGSCCSAAAGAGEMVSVIGLMS